jgi:hypothetical protein
MLVGEKIENIVIVKLVNNFILDVKLNSAVTSIEFRGNRSKLYSQNCFNESIHYFLKITFVIDENANYLQHKVLDRA